MVNKSKETAGSKCSANLLEIMRTSDDLLTYNNGTGTELSAEIQGGKCYLLAGI